MATIRLSGKEYAVTPQAEAFLMSYLSRVRRYVSAHGISEEYAQDIENRLAEKLSYVGTECQEGEAVRIVNELGEPEDVFADAPKAKKNGLGDIAWAVKENMKSPLYRDSSKGIIFGVCAGLGDKFEIDPFFIRLLFVFLFFFYGTGVLAYLVLALLMKDKSALETPGVQNGGIKAKTDAAIAKISSASPVSASEVIGWTFAMIGSILAFFFFGFLAFFLFSASLGFLAAFGASMSGIVIENQNLFGWAHPALPFAAGAVGATLFVLSWIAAFRAFGKKIATWWVLAIAGIVIAVSFAAGAYGTFKTVANFAQRERTETVSDTEISTWALSVEFSETDLPRSESFPTLPDWMEIRVVKSDSGTAKIRAVTEISASDSESAKNQFSKIVPVSVSASGSVVKIGNAAVKYAEKSPYAFAKRVIEISVPASVRVKFQKLPRHAEVTGISRTEFDSHSSYDGSCAGSEIRYSEESKAFVCDPFAYSANVVENAKIAYLENTAYDEVPKLGSSDPGLRTMPYRYDDRIVAKALPDGTFEVTYFLEYGHPENVPDTVTKTFRVDVSPSGEMSKTEIVSK